VDLPKTFEMMRGRACVISGIDHMELMFKGTPQAVEEEAKRVLDLWGKSPGFIIAPGCEIPFKTPKENILSLRVAAEKFGTY
jgi:uroporphyrinogen decarboxylase